MNWTELERNRNPALLQDKQLHKKKCVVTESFQITPIVLPAFKLLIGLNGTNWEITFEFPLIENYHCRTHPLENKSSLAGSSPASIIHHNVRTVSQCYLETALRSIHRISPNFSLSYPLVSRVREINIKYRKKIMYPTIVSVWSLGKVSLANKIPSLFLLSHDKSS